MEGASTSTNSGTQVPQKRVLPARSRRGGPGVGNCEMDIMILERQKRRLEYDPLIPAQTRLLLTTNPHTIANSSSTIKLGMNIFANDRYFDRPEVVKAYREQQVIQTPEFDKITGNPAAMGRLRPRNSEDGTVDTSDATYEKRHRKYEAFEKRIRLREKEKLKHEQYKLKERIDQLRAMDGGAFLSLPATSFSPAPGQHDNSEDNRLALPGARSGAAVHNEGERRRKEMLDVASYLEERYRILLPPDRFRKAPGPSNNTPAELEGVVYVDTDNNAELGDELLMETAPRDSEKKQSEKLKSKFKIGGKPGRQGRLSTKRKKSLSLLRANNDEVPEFVSLAPEATDHEPTPVLSSPSPRSEAASRPTTPISNPDIVVLEPNSRDVTLAPQEEREENPDIPLSAAPSPSPVVVSPAASSESPEPAPVRRGRKRVKLSSPLPSASSRKATRATSVPPIESIPDFAPQRVSQTRKQSPKHVSYAGIAGKTERTRSLLMVAAVRSSGNTARKTGRHITAFGDKIPLAVGAVEEYPIPPWVLPADKLKEV